MNRVRALVVLLALAVSVWPAGALADGYHGVEYDLSGTQVSLDRPVASVNALAASIVASTERTLGEIARRRSALKYGRIDPGRRAPEVLVYPAAPGQPASDQYSARLTGPAGAAGSFVYQVPARKLDTNREDDTSWTSFTLSGTVVVAVRKLQGRATGCRVRPSSARIPTSFQGDTCTFVMHGPANVSVEFAPDTENPVLHPMLVFANPPEAQVPAADDPDVLYLGPGVHQLGAGVQLRSGETVYLAPGAWVEGTFVGRGVSNVTIRGRGVLSGAFLDTGNQSLNQQQPGMIDIQRASNVLIEGITLVDGPRFNVRALGQYMTIENVKVMSWWFNTDGVVGGNSSLLEHNFIKVNDDSIKLFWGDTIARDNVVWQLENGAPFMISWNIEQDSANFHVYDNDVIHAEHYQFQAQAIFRARHAGKGHLQRYLFEDDRVEDANWRLFYLILENNKWYDPALGYGQISDIVFRNITADEPMRLPDVVRGIDAQHMVNDVTFQDVKVDGTALWNAGQGNFQIDPGSTDQIRLLARLHGS